MDGESRHALKKRTRVLGVHVQERAHMHTRTRYNREAADPYNQRISRSRAERNARVAGV